MDTLLTALLHDRPGQPWLTADPFLFAVHHVDRYPAGDSSMALPMAARASRQLGQDFAGRDGLVCITDAVFQDSRSTHIEDLKPSQSSDEDL
jgi:hypothetical protein